MNLLLSVPALAQDSSMDSVVRGEEDEAARAALEGEPDALEDPGLSEPEAEPAPEPEAEGEPEPDEGGLAELEAEEQDEVTSHLSGDGEATPGQQGDAKQRKLKSKTSQKEPAPAQPESKEAGKRRAPIDYGLLPLTYHQKRAQIAVGARVHWFQDETMDLFSGSNALGSFHLGGSLGVWQEGKASVAAGLHWGHLTTSAVARETDTELRVNRLQIGGEFRYHLHHRWSVQGGVGLGVAMVQAQLGATDELAPMRSTPLGFAGEVAVGSSIRVWGSSDGRKRSPRAHLYVEAGYAGSSSLPLEFQVVDGGPLRAEGVRLGSLSLGAPFLGLGVQLSY